MGGTTSHPFCLAFCTWHEYNDLDAYVRYSAEWLFTLKAAYQYKFNPNRSLDHSVNIFACFPSCDGVFCRLFSRHSRYAFEKSQQKPLVTRAEIKQSLMIDVG